MSVIKSRILLSLLIILTSLIYGLPHIIMNQRLGKEYEPIAITKDASIPKDKGYGYAPYVNKVKKDGFFLKEAYLYEYRNTPTPYVGETFSSNVLAILSNLTGSISNAFMVADFIMPPFIFLILFMVAKTLIKNTMFAAGAAFAATIWRDLLLVLPYPKETIDYLTAAVNQQQFLHYSRAYHPQITFPVFGLSILVLMRLVKKVDARKTVILGILIGTSFYSYLFYWTYLLFFMFTLFVVFLIKKSKKIALSIAIAVAISLIIGSYYFYNIYLFYSLNISKDFTEKMTGPSVPFNLSTLRFLIIPFLFGLITQKTANLKMTFIVFLTSGVLIIFASRIAMDRDLETFHYIRRALIPFATIAVFTIFYNLIKNRKGFITLSAAFILLTAASSGIKIQITATNILAKDLVVNNAQKDLFKWLNSNTSAESVIGTFDSDLNDLMPSRTDNYIYFPPTLRTITPTDEEVERFIVLSNLLGINSETQKKSLSQFLGYMFHAKYYRQNPKRDDIRKSVEQEIDQKINGEWEKIYNKYKIDYVIVSDLDAQRVNPNTRFLTLVQLIDQYKIFKVKNFN